MVSSQHELKERLKRKFKEIFQFESEDLDFGIYRIMNYKRKEIEKFIEKELIEEIKNQLQLLSEDERKEIEEKLKELSSKNGVKKYLEALEKGDEERARIYKEDFKEQIEDYERLKRQLEEIKISEDLERQVYNHLITFFSRYYDNGDFISKRRYGKNEKYVVPYNGEEVLLYWANKDQYYIKTTEYFRKYTFRIKGFTANFKVVEAEEEKGNVKAEEKKFFLLNEEIFDFDEEKREINIYFEYRALTDDEKEKYKHVNSVSQEKANEETIKILNEKIPENSVARLIFEKEGEKTLIEKHLYRYTRRNTTDYFIHKDLKGFLERELDFYIKNEFLQLDDLQVLEQSGYFDKLRLYLIGVRVFRNIALKIIEFLAQIENFQKKIWEKKKFVFDTHFVITLDKIKDYAGEEFLESILDKILSNKKQLKEWKELFGYEVKSKKDLIENNTLLDGKEWKKLPVDTKYFDDEFKWKLLVALSKNNDLDEILDGVLIKSENFQALNLLLNKYYEKVQTIYIDPPFNKDNEADYLYKVGYKDATWITMLENRILLGKDLLNERGSIFVRCDYNGNMYVRMLLNEIFGEGNFRNEITIAKSPKITEKITRYHSEHDTVFFYARTENLLFEPANARRDERKWRPMHLPGVRWSPIREEYVHLFSPKNLKEKNGKFYSRTRIICGKEYIPPDGRHWALSQEAIFELEQEGLIRINEKGEPEALEGEYKKLTDIWTDIRGYSQTTGFKTENSEILLKRVIESTSNEGDLILDFFLGSGTTTAVAHKLRRKWVGVEMGEHFYTVILPRMKKVLFYDKSGISKEKDVKEKYNKKTAGGFFKYHTLEQYEDALENIEFEEQNEKQQKLLLELPDYFVKYMLEWETKKSKTFLNLNEIKDPFNYNLKIIENYQQKMVNVDLIETFNYLLGLNIKTYNIIEDNNRKYAFVFGEKQGRKITIVWRSMKNIDFEKDKEVIEREIKDFNPDEIYINGDAIVKGFRAIEPLFKSLMFEEV